MPHDRETRAPRRAARRKDRLIQTRVARDLESTLKREARRRRLTVSHLIRNVLEDTFQLVDDVVDGVDGIVSESVELARRVGSEARRMAGAVREAVSEVAEADDAASEADEAGPAEPGAQASDDPLSHVFAWNAVIANQAVTCAHCGGEIARGGDAFVGLSDDASRPRTWLCTSCRAAL
jgi:hypothetical protein